MKKISVPWKTNFYYRNRLNPEYRAIYDALYDGYSAWQTTIPLPDGCTLNQVSEVFYLVMFDNPIFFHVGRDIEIRSSFSAVLIADYRLTQNEYAVLYRQVLNFVQKCQITLSGSTPYEQVRSIHNSIIKHVEYYGKEEEDSHNVTGTILKKKAVCESMAKAFKLICDSCQIPSIVAFGKALSDEGQNGTVVSEEGFHSNHAWNMVRLGSQWYNIDVTFDLSHSIKDDDLHIRYDYFCRSDQVFAAEHRPTGKNLPHAPVDHDIYRIRKEYIQTSDELRRYVAECVKKGHRHFDFEYSPLITEDISYIQKLIKSALDAVPYRSFTAFYNKKLHIATIKMVYKKD